MSREQKDKRKSQDKRRWAKYPVRIFGVIALSILFIIIIGHFRLIPIKVHGEIEKSLLKFWNGQVDIEGLEINYFGPIHLGKIRFFDRAGQERLYTNGVKMVFEKWPGPHPVVTEVEIEKLHLQLSTVDGRLTLPFINPFQQSPAPKKKFDIRKLTINDAEITVTDAQEKKILYENLQLLANKRNNFYDFLLSRIGSTPSESLRAKGSINPNTLETKVSLQIKHTLKRPETSLVFAALNIPDFSAEGKLDADLTITGCLKGPDSLKPNGVVRLDGLTVTKDDKIIAKNLTTKINASNGRYVFENITATVCEGSVIGSSYVETKKNQPAEFHGQVSAQNISFIELTSILGGTGRKAAKGTVIFDYNFSGKGKDLQNLAGEGQIFLDDADISVIPIVPYIFNMTGLSQIDPLKMSDVECTFTTAGPVVTIENANIANRFAAIRAEPGGTINLQTKQIDLYVKAVLLKEIDDIIKRIPIVNIFDNLKDKLTRLKVQGNWSDTPTKLVKKEPIKDIKEATVGFLQDVINSGGQITKEMRKKSTLIPNPK